MKQRDVHSEQRVVRTDPLPSLLSKPFGCIHPHMSIKVPDRPRLRATRLEPITLSQEMPVVEELTYQHRSLDAVIKTVPLPDLDCIGFHRILHLGCRTGEWAIEMARAYPSTWVVGIDRSRSCINQAGRLALEEGLSNVEFLARSIDGVVLRGYEKRPFHLIYVSFIAGDISAADLPDILHTLIEHCVDGSQLLWAEMEFPLTNSYAVERFHALIVQALQIAGRAFGPGPHLGITPLMRNWLAHAGCRIQSDTCYPIDISHGSPTRDLYINHLEEYGKWARSSVVATGVTTKQAYDRLFQQALADMLTLTFCGISNVRVVHAVHDPKVDYGVLTI